MRNPRSKMFVEPPIGGADGEAPGARGAEQERRAPASEPRGELVGVGLEEGSDAIPRGDDGGVELVHFCPFCLEGLYGFC